LSIEDREIRFENRDDESAFRLFPMLATAQGELWSLRGTGGRAGCSSRDGRRLADSPRQVRPRSANGSERPRVLMRPCERRADSLSFPAQRDIDAVSSRWPASSLGATVASSSFLARSRSPVRIHTFGAQALECKSAGGLSRRRAGPG
jgi:hypothetical protein